MQSEALLACSCGMRGLGAYDHLEQGVGFAWALLRNESSCLVEGLDIVDICAPQCFRAIKNG